ncbi:MAG TPA: peptidase [Patescibacteria group bacterium]|nr:peptidase [Patescibacteria group bacterium]
MENQSQLRQITIKDAVEELEKARESTVISYISDSRAIFDPDDCLMLDDNLSQLTNGGQNKIKKLDLLLQSPGGILEAAYKFFRICKDYSEEFNVIVPLSAKSAATTICLGANEVVMTTISELGPVDPIIQHPSKPEIRIPARAIKEYMDFISNSSENFTIDPNLKETLNKSLDAYLIGSYEMALKNSKEIIERVLKENKRTGLDEEQIKIVTKELTEKHASHSYPIDRKELIELGFKNIVKAEDKPDVVKAIKQLFGVYTQFMRQNNLIKLQGNRYQNKHIQLIRIERIDQNKIVPPVSFS